MVYKAIANFESDLRDKVTSAILIPHYQYVYCMQLSPFQLISARLLGASLTFILSIE